MARTLEIRCYTLVPGTGEEFHRTFVAESLPMLERWGVDVVAYGASLHHADSYLLVRAYADADERERSQDAFYGSAEWRDGPRARLLSLIQSHTTVLLELDDAAVGVLRGATLRRSTESPPPPRQPG